jgi:hypothetical protein
MASRVCQGWCFRRSVRLGTASSDSGSWLQFREGVDVEIDVIAAI